MLDCQFFKLNAGRHHLTSLLLHTANTLLLFLVLKRMTGALWRCALVAALFAWHPLHVESVAWMAERKDVLSALFWWLTLWAWLGYTDACKNPGSKSKLFYVLAVFLFVLAAMSKPMVVTLALRSPAPGFLAVAPLPAPRFPPPPPAAGPNRAPRRRPRPPPPASPPPGACFWKKFPSSPSAPRCAGRPSSSRQHGGAMLDAANLPLGDRIGNAFISYIRYPAKMFWPADLSALYIRIGKWPAWEVAAAAILFAGLTAWIVAQARPRPWLAVGWFWYAGMLVPVIGLVQVGMQTMADRYTYLPLAGLFIILAWGGAELAARFRSLKYALPFLAGLSLAACLIVTARQIPCWQKQRNALQKND